MKNSNPLKNITCLEQAKAAWREFAPDAKFGNITLSEFEAFVAESETSRSDLTDNNNERMAIIVRRENSDSTALAKRELLVAGVVADPNFGPDSAFYEALGYIRKSARRSGLTRKKSNPV